MMLSPSLRPLVYCSTSSNVSRFKSLKISQFEENKKTKSKEKEKETKIITSVSNPLVKHCVKLRQSSSYRRSCGSTVVVGLTPILEICRFQELHNDELPIVDCLLLLDGVVSPEGLDDSCSSVVHVTSNVMKKLSGMQSIDSLEGIALMRIPRSFYDLDGNQEEEEIHWSFLTSPHRILVLDGIQRTVNSLQLLALIDEACIAEKQATGKVMDLLSMYLYFKKPITTDLKSMLHGHDATQYGYASTDIPPILVHPTVSVCLYLVQHKYGHSNNSVVSMLPDL